MKRLQQVFTPSIITPSVTATLAAAILASSTPARAFQFTITDKNATFNTELTNLENQVNNNFAPGMEDNFIKSMAEASRGTTAGESSDGVVRGDLFSISTSMGIAASTTGSFGSIQAGKNQLPGVGVGAQPAVTIGFNAKKLPKAATLGLDPAKVDYFISFMKLDLSNITADAGFTLSNFGLTGRYWVVDPKSTLWAFRWDGVSIITGIQHSSFDANFKSNLNFSQTSSGAGAVNWAPTAAFGVTASTWSIPIDVKTGITLLKFWTLSTSAGARFNFGSAQTTGAITGDITSGATKVGTGTLDLTSTAQKPSSVSARFSLGNQFNFGPVKLFADAGYSTPKVADVTLGLRFVW